jgi:hypothetical protein
VKFPYNFILFKKKLNLKSLLNFLTILFLKNVNLNKIVKFSYNFILFKEKIKLKKLWNFFTILFKKTI